MLAFHAGMLHSSTMLTWAHTCGFCTEPNTFRNLHSYQRNLGFEGHLVPEIQQIMQSAVREQPRLGKGVLGQRSGWLRSKAIALQYWWLGFQASAWGWKPAGKVL